MLRLLLRNPGTRHTRMCVTCDLALQLSTHLTRREAEAAGRSLYYTILYYTILYYTILYYTILYYTILYYTITILAYTMLCSTRSPASELTSCSLLMTLLLSCLVASSSSSAIVCVLRAAGSLYYTND